MHQERLGHHVAQEAEPGHDRAEGDGLSDDVGELDLQHVAGLRALDEHRAGERMHRTGIERGKIGDRGGRRDLAIERVAGLQRDFLALADLGYLRDVGVVAVVAAVRLIAEPLASIDMDRVHGGCSVGVVHVGGQGCHECGGSVSRL